MAINEFVLDEGKRWFVEEGRVDPLTHEPFRMGDRVVICDDCRLVYLASTWDDCDGCVGIECNCKRTRREFLERPVRAREISPTELFREMIILRRHTANASVTSVVGARTSEGEIVIIRWSNGN